MLFKVIFKYLIKKKRTYKKSNDTDCSLGIRA